MCDMLANQHIYSSRNYLYQYTPVACNFTRAVYIMCFAHGGAFRTIL